MEPLRQDDPGQLGVYSPVGRIDAADSGVPVPVRRFIARTPGGDHTVLLSLPRLEFARDGEHGQRFGAEAEQARRLSGHSPTLEQIVEVSWGTDGQLPWCVSPYSPALPLPGALAAQGGGLGERTVRALGLALAEALAALHEQGFAHAGVAPGTVLLGADGPRLTGFGCVRSLAPEGEERVAVPGLPPEALPPEQLSGGRPRPPGDVFGLGAVLSYAATGRLAPDASGLPEGLREAVSPCLSPDPAHRPRAAAVRDALRGRFVPPAPAFPPSPAPGWAPATVMDGGAGAFGPGWLPGRVIAALVRQSGRALGAQGPSAPSGAAGAVRAAGADTVTSESDVPLAPGGPALHPGASPRP